MGYIIFILSTLLVVSVIFLIKYRYKFKKISDYILSEKRTGYYDINYHRIEDEDGKKSIGTVRITISEIERYTNGTSKIEFVRAEAINCSGDLSGVLSNKAEKEFSTIKKTDDIEFLEPEKTLKQKRKEKLNQLNNTKFGIKFKMK